MATIKIILDTRTQSKSGGCPIKIKITHNRKSTTISTGISVSPDCWDAVGGKVIKAAQRNTINAALTRIRASYETALLEMQARGIPLSSTPAGVKRQIAGLISPESERSPEDQRPIASLGSVLLDYIKTSTSGRTSEIYRATLSKLEQYCDPHSIRLDEINKQWLDDFDAYLSERSPAANSRSIHLRNIRAVYNYAIDEELTTHYPFRRYKIVSGLPRRRAMSVDALRAIIALDNLHPADIVHRDMFVLTFFLIGINSADLYDLRPIVNGRAEYIRAKTRRPYSIKVEPEAMEIIARYHGGDHAVDLHKRYKSDRVYNIQTNKRLKDIGAKTYTTLDGSQTPICEDLSPYWARHTWATIAASIDIPKDTIAAALGHGGHTVTDVYIDFDQRKVDEANRRVIDYVLGIKRKETSTAAR